jgi:transposase
MNQGAPNAIQVADRFHLLQNLVEPLEQIFSAHRQALGEIENATDPEAPAVVILPPAKPLRSLNRLPA